MKETSSMDASPPASEPWFKKRNLWIDFLIVLFGIGSWIGVSSTYLQLPLIVRTAPEGWALPSFLVITVQCGNIGSMLYVLVQKFSTKKCNDGYLIYITFGIGCVAALGMAFFYQRTFEIAGQQRSVALLLFAWMFAIVGCVSSVLFMPYMGRFRDIYMVTYLIGQSLNGFLSSITALIQGVGGAADCIPNNSTDGPAFIKYTPEPLFQPREYFLFVFGMIFLSAVAFVLLNTLKSSKKEYTAGHIVNGNEYHYDQSEKSEINNEYVPEDVRNLSSFDYKFLMSIIALICVIGNGIFPGLQSFSCLPYGNSAYHLSASLQSVANPVAGFFALFVPHTSIRNVKVLSIFLVVVSAYIILTSLQSPNPPLVGTLIGEILIVSVAKLNTIPLEK